MHDKGFFDSLALLRFDLALLRQRVERLDELAVKGALTPYGQRCLRQSRRDLGQAGAALAVATDAVRRGHRRLN